MALDSKSVHQPHTSEQRMVSSRENTSENDSVDDTSSSFGARHLKNDGERRGAGLFGVEIGIVVWDVETDEKD
jgi:hypothetical protein